MVADRQLVIALADVGVVQKETIAKVAGFTSVQFPGACQQLLLIAPIIMVALPGTLFSILVSKATVVVVRGRHR